MFFVATAPSGGDGHVNLSPKGYDTLRILDANRVAYLDLTGSGVETISHLRENGRITLMACAFTGNPRISRLYGRGSVHPFGSPEFDALAPHFPELPGRRSIIEIAVDRVTTSCGEAVPLMDLVDDRDRLARMGHEEGRRRHHRVLGSRRTPRASTDCRGCPRDVRGACANACARAWRSSASTCCSFRSVPTCRT